LDIAEETRKNREYSLKKIQSSDLGSMRVDEITTRDLYPYLESQSTDWVRQNRRAMFLQFFTWAIQTGLRQDNPATALERPKAKRSRQRLTIEEFKVLRTHAPAWLQNAMDLGLHTLQRPGDVLLLRWEDMTPTSLRVIQRKIGAPLRAVLDSCRNEVLSPFIVHRLPEKMRPRGLRAKARAHHTQVLLEQAEREFDEVRTISVLYKQTDCPPTLHEIRSLGASLYREAGWPEGQVQLLLGHSEVQMTRHYLEGHEAPWERITAGLNLR
jgi:integrase